MSRPPTAAPTTIRRSTTINTDVGSLNHTTASATRRRRALPARTRPRAPIRDLGKVPAAQTGAAGFPFPGGRVPRTGQSHVAGTLEIPVQVPRAWDYPARVFRTTT